METIINSLTLSPNICTYVALTVNSVVSTHTFSTTPNTFVQTNFDFTIGSFLTANIPLSSWLLVEFPTYDVGFLTNSNLQCLVTSVAKTCYSFNLVGWVLIDLGTAVTAAGVTLKINNM